MAFKFENLVVGKNSLDLGEKINVLADTFPSKELYNLSSQIQRAADSIGLNIAEGSTGQSNPEQKRFLIFANRSALEVAACIIKAKRRSYIDDRTYIEIYKDCENLVRMLQAFINKLK
jgi:four helix bundle protein